MNSPLEAILASDFLCPMDTANGDDNFQRYRQCRPVSLEVAINGREKPQSSGFWRAQRRSFVRSADYRRP